MLLPYRILERKRAGMRLDAEEIRSVAKGATDGSWSEGQLAAFLRAAAIRGLDGEETRALTLAMRDSGELWDLGAEVPRLCDKHSTGGVGDKISLAFIGFPFVASLAFLLFIASLGGLSTPVLAAAGGLGVGIFETLWDGYFQAIWRDAATYAVLCALLVATRRAGNLAA